MTTEPAVQTNRHDSQQTVNNEELRQRNKMRVKTVINKKDILCIDNYDDEQADLYKYCCPVCLRYFNHILVSSCCQNYICRFCIGQMSKKAKTNEKYVIRCVHCMNDQFKLRDVDAAATVKEYTDTPAKFRMARH